jgi:hypothetical protein
MTRLQQEYVHRVETKMDELEVVDGTTVRVLGAGPDGPTVVPTTEELLEYVHQKNEYRKIEKIQEDCLQRAEEKVAIANQTYSLVDDICKRLDSDVTALEKLLQVRFLLVVSCFIILILPED